ncbi:hypothetical protein ACKWTF_008124 [Chironomus riparius]
MAAEEDRLAKAFENKVIFLTGGTGFMGKIFIERLLRDTEVSKIYLLVRPKRGKTPRQRVTEIFNDPLFDLLKEKISIETILSKTDVINGNCEELDVGISEEDRQFIIENITQIFHFAATIRFDEAMKKAVLMNTRGSREMLKLARQCKKLELYGHMSTAYCHLHVQFLLEQPYDPPADPNEIIKMIENMSDEEIENQSKGILEKLNLPNTYAFTKSLAEALVVEARNKHKLPVLIFRPSIILATWRDPIPGYVDNFNGPIGLMLAVGKGVARSMYCDQKSYGDFVPVDIAINALFISVWNFYTYKNEDHFIIHFTSSNEIRLTWEDMAILGKETIQNDYPFNQILWYPNITMTQYRWLHSIRAFLFHWIPAYVVDFLLQMLGYQQFMKKAALRVDKAVEVLEYYANNQWDFDASIQCLFKSRLTPYEENKYKVNARGISIRQVFSESALGLRRYVDKTPDSMIPAAFRLLKIMNIVDKVTKLVVYGSLFYWLYTLILALAGGANIPITILKLLFCLFAILI